MPQICPSRSDVEQLHEITVGRLKFQITFYLGGDWKFLATVTVNALSGYHTKAFEDEDLDIVLTRQNPFVMVPGRIHQNISVPKTSLLLVLSDQKFQNG